MNLLKKFSQKLKRNKEKKQTTQLSPELKAWGQEILLESLQTKVNPEYYDVRKIGRLWYIFERYDAYDDDNERTGEFVWKKRYSEFFDGSKPGSFKTKKAALAAVESHIEAAFKHFNQVYEDFVNKYGDESSI